MNEKVKEKMRKRCEWIWNVSNFFYYATLLCLIILAIYFVVALFKSPNSFYVDTSARVKEHTAYVRFSRDISFGVSGGDIAFDALSHAKQIFFVILGAIIINGFPTLFITWKLRTIFDSLDNEQTPFTIKNCKSLAHISYALILVGLLSKMFPNIMLFIFGFSKHVRFSMNYNYLFLGCIVLALSYFFEYGVVLQQESDELL